MCGVIGVVGKTHVNHYIFDGLSLLQHRGQDAAGIATLYNNKFFLQKGNGMINDVFNTQRLSSLIGHMGIGHVRYPTAGSPCAEESQPFYVNSPCGIMLGHNGNLTNVAHLNHMLQNLEKRHLNTTSDSELLLNFFAYGLSEYGNIHNTTDHTPDSIFHAVRFINTHAKGAYSCTAIVTGLGLVAFRDINGIRPLVLGKNTTQKGCEYMIASESVALDITGFKLIRDIAPGEAIVITEEGKMYSKICTDTPALKPCLFEFVYFARPDSVIDKVNVYQCRIDAGKALGKTIQNAWSDKQIDTIIPIPETGRVAAQEIADILGVPYREGFVKNRYVGRTFIMPTATGRTNSVRRKLNPIASEFKNKNVLLVDDSIVRGTTSKKIIETVRDLGAKNVYLASASPEIKFPNVYGIDMPTRKELLANNRSLQEIEQFIGVDGLIYLGLNDLKKAVKLQNPYIEDCEDSVFSGAYVSGDVDEAYLDALENRRQRLDALNQKHQAFVAENLIAEM